MTGLRSVRLYLQPSTDPDRAQLAVEFVGENGGTQLTKIYPRPTTTSSLFPSLEAYNDIKLWVLDGELRYGQERWHFTAGSAEWTE